MTEQGLNELTNALSECAAALQTALIVKTGKNRVFSVPDDRREWPAPALRPDLRLGKINLNPLPKALYGELPLAVSQLTEMWDNIVDGMFRGDKAAKLSHLYFPRICFIAAPPSASLVQLLCALSWSSGTLSVSKSEVHLNFGRGVLGLRLDQRTVTHRGFGRRLPRACGVDPIQVLTRPQGRVMKLATADLTAVHRHLALEFPEFVPALDVICATAVHAGRQFELMVSRQFDVVPIEDMLAPTATVWVKARAIINTAVEAPYAELWALMKDTMAQDAFVKLFGNPHRKRTSVYSTRMRQHHTNVIDRAENGEINMAVYRKVGGQVEAVSSLLKFQQMMGSPA